MKLRTLAFISALTLTAVATQPSLAHASVVTYDITGATIAGAVTGTLAIDTTTGLATSGDITFHDPAYGNPEFAGFDESLPLSTLDYAFLSGGSGTVLLVYDFAGLTIQSGKVTLFDLGTPIAEYDITSGTLVAETAATPPPTTTPEPSSLLLLGTGIFTLGTLSRLRHRPTASLLLLLVITLAAARPARASTLAPCAMGTVTSILGTDCTIGDKTFTFDATAWGGGLLSSDDVVFTPDATNPLSPGFILTARFGRPVPVFSLTGGSTTAVDLEELDYGVSLTNPGSGDVIVGTTVTETGAAVSWTDPTTNNLKAQTESFLSAGACNDFPNAGIITQNSILLYDSPSVTADDFLSEGCTAVTAAQGEAQIFLVAQNGVVSLTSGGYYVDEAASSISVTTTPEPSSLLLLGTGLLSLAALSRQKVVRSA